MCRSTTTAMPTRRRATRARATVSASATTVALNDDAMANADPARALDGARTRADALGALGALAKTAAEIMDAVGALAAPGPKPGGRSKPYGDPARRACLATEMKVQIQGVPGDFCSPSCSVASPCPKDPYRGRRREGCACCRRRGAINRTDARWCVIRETTRRTEDVRRARRVDPWRRWGFARTRVRDRGVRARFRVFVFFCTTARARDIVTIFNQCAPVK